MYGIYVCSMYIHVQLLVGIYYWHVDVVDLAVDIKLFANIVFLTNSSKMEKERKKYIPFLFAAKASWEVTINLA